MEMHMSHKPFTRRSSGLIRQASLLDTFAYNVAASSYVGTIVFYFWTISWLPSGNILAAIPAVLPAFAIALTLSLIHISEPTRPY